MTDFENIINETKRPVLAAIRRYLKTEYFYAIDDVAQEVYLRAYRALTAEKLRDQGKLRSYLYTIAKNESLRMNNRCRREEMKAEKFLIEERQKIDYSRPISDDDSELSDRVSAELHHLPLHYAQVVKLTLMGFSAKEIVEELAIKPGTVKSRLSRGLALLRERLV